MHAKPHCTCHISDARTTMAQTVVGKPASFGLARQWLRDLTRRERSSTFELRSWRLRNPASRSPFSEHFSCHHIGQELSQATTHSLILFFAAKEDNSTFSPTAAQSQRFFLGSQSSVAWTAAGRVIIPQHGIITASALMHGGPEHRRRRI